jgi:hypothetical protein
MIITFIIEIAMRITAIGFLKLCAELLTVKEKECFKVLQAENTI